MPWGKYEPTVGRRKPMDVVLAESLGHHAERLKYKDKRILIIDGFSDLDRRLKVDYRDFLTLIVRQHTGSWTCTGTYFYRL